MKVYSATLNTRNDSGFVTILERNRALGGWVEARKGGSVGGVGVGGVWWHCGGGGRREWANRGVIEYVDRHERCAACVW